MKSKFVGLIVTLALLALSALPASAGHYVLKYEEKGQVSVELFTDDSGHQCILFRALPLTGDRTAGPAVIRFNGVNVGEKLAPTYEWEFRLDTGEIPSLLGDPKKGGELCIPWLKGDPKQRVDLRNLTRGVHTVEVYFASRGGDGRLDRNRTAAPATQFRVEETSPPAAATTGAGQAMTADQLNDAIKASYEQGSKAGKDAAAQEREQLLLELKKATDELNQLRKDKVVVAKAPTMPILPRYVPVAWKQAWPDPKDEMVLIRDGKVVAKAKVIEIFPTAARLWVMVNLPADFVVDGQCKIERAAGRDSGYHVGEKRN